MELSALRKKFFLATQRPPFTGAYRAAYDAALRLVVSRLGHREGVAAAYLTSGMLDEPEYGLSDIDLTVIVEDDGAKRRVLELLGRLRLVAPMLGPVEQQLVWTRAELARRFAGSPFIQFRLGGGRARRLLLGTDLLATLAADMPAVRQAAAEMWFVWGPFVPLLAGGAPPDANRLFRKTLADVARAARFASHGERLESRAACLERVADVVDPALLAVARAPREHPPIRPADAFRAVHAVLAAYAAALPAEEPTHALEEVGPLEPPPDIPAGATPAAGLWLDGGVEDPLGLGRPRAHVVWRTPPSDDELARLAGRADVEITAELDGVVVPLSAEPVTGVGTRATHPEMFAGHDGRIGAARFAFAAQQIAARRRAIAGLLADRRVFRHDAGRLRILAATSHERASGSRIAVAASVAIEPAARPRELIRRLAELHGVDPRALLGDPAAAQTMAVLICTRNRAELLRTALESIAAQRRPADEVIVVDNGSADHTREVVESFAGRLPIRYAHLPEPSIPAARNAALRAATADLLCFIDDDAVADPGWLAGYEETFRADPRIGVVGGSIWPLRAQRGLIADFYRYQNDPEDAGGHP